MFWSWSTSDQSYHCNVLSTQFPTIWENSYWSWHLLRRFSSDHPLCSSFQTSLVSCWGAGAQLGENSLVFIASYSIVCLGYISPWQGGRRLPAFVHVNLRKLLASSWFWSNQFQLNLNPIFPVPLDVISIKWECSTIPTLYFVNRGTRRKFIRTFV